MDLLSLSKQHYKLLLAIPLVAITLWGIDYYGDNYSRTDQYYVCDLSTATFDPKSARLADTDKRYSWELPVPLNKEYMHITTFYYGKLIFANLENLRGIFTYDDCKIEGKVLRCFSDRDSGGTNLIFNFQTNEGKALIRQDKSYTLKCQLQ